MRHDAFADGSHIRGLILNFLHVKWPELAKGGFVRVLQTPIVRATRAGGQVRDFYNLTEFNAWSASGASAGYRVKYYKVRTCSVKPMHCTPMHFLPLHTYIIPLSVVLPRVLTIVVCCCF